MLLLYFFEIFRSLPFRRRYGGLIPRTIDGDTCRTMGGVILVRAARSTSLFCSIVAYYPPSPQPSVYDHIYHSAILITSESAVLP